MATFNSLDEVLKVIKQSIRIVLEDDVGDLIKREEQNAIESVVYGAGSPRKYERRREDGGLKDTSNMWTEIYGDDNTFVLDVSNITVFNTGEGRRSEYLANDCEKLLSDEVFFGRRKYLKSSKGKGKGGAGLDMLVEYGQGGDGFTYDAGEGWWSKPRPFTQTTIENLNASKKHVSVLKQGLIDRGIPVE